MFALYHVFVIFIFSFKWFALWENQLWFIINPVLTLLVLKPSRGSKSLYEIWESTRRNFETLPFHDFSKFVVIIDSLHLSLIWFSESKWLWSRFEKSPKKKQWPATSRFRRWTCSFGSGGVRQISRACRQSKNGRGSTGGDRRWGDSNFWGKKSKITFQIPPSQQYNVRQASAASLANPVPSSSSRPPLPPHGNSLEIKIDFQNIFTGAASPQISPSSTVVHRRVVRSARRVVQSVVYTPTIPEHRHEQRLVRGGNEKHSATG